MTKNQFMRFWIRGLGKKQVLAQDFKSLCHFGDSWRDLHSKFSKPFLEEFKTSRCLVARAVGQFSLPGAPASSKRNVPAHDPPPESPRTPPGPWMADGPSPSHAPGAGASCCPHADGHVGAGPLTGLPWPSALGEWEATVSSRTGSCGGACGAGVGPRLPARGAERAPPLAQRPRHPRAVAYIHPRPNPTAPPPPLRPPLLSSPPSPHRELAARSPPPRRGSPPATPVTALPLTALCLLGRAPSPPLSLPGTVLSDPPGIARPAIRSRIRALPPRIRTDLAEMGGGFLWGAVDLPVPARDLGAPRAFR